MKPCVKAVQGTLLDKTQTCVQIVVKKKNLRDFLGRFICNTHMMGKFRQSKKSSNSDPPLPKMGIAQVVPPKNVSL